MVTEARTIFTDVPGQGKSDKTSARDPTYSIKENETVALDSGNYMKA
jgi:hypothetical protein